MDFDFERFRELLEFEDDFIKNEKSLLRNNREKYYDLALAKIRIEDQIFWCERSQYLDLLKSYQLEETDVRTLARKWNLVIRECYARYAKLTNLARNSDSTAHQAELEKLFQNLGDSSSEGFSTLVTSMFIYRLAYPDTKLSFPISFVDFDVNFDKRIERKINKLQQYLI